MDKESVRLQPSVGSDQDSSLASVIVKVPQHLLCCIAITQFGVVVQEEKHFAARVSNSVIAPSTHTPILRQDYDSHLRSKSAQDLLGFAIRAIDNHNDLMIVDGLAADRFECS